MSCPREINGPRAPRPCPFLPYAPTVSNQQHARLTDSCAVASHPCIRIRWHLMGNSEILLLRNLQSATCLLATKAVSPSLTLSAEGPVASCCFRNHAKRRDVTARPDLPARINVQYANNLPVCWFFFDEPGGAKAPAECLFAGLRASLAEAYHGPRHAYLFLHRPVPPWAPVAYSPAGFPFDASGFPPLPLQSAADLYPAPRGSPRPRERGRAGASAALSFTPRAEQ
jgi:hypothetical protein